MERNSLVFSPRVYRDFRQWKVERDAELLMQEDTSVKIDHDKLKRKVQAEIDLVERKLRDEAKEKRVQVGNEVAEKNRVNDMFFVFICSVYLHTHLSYFPGAYAWPQGYQTEV